MEDRTVPTVTTVTAVGDAIEGGAAGSFTVTRDHTVGWESVGLTFSGTATEYMDYGHNPLFLTFAPGENTATVTVTGTTDSSVEGTETVTLTAAYGGSATINLYDANTPQVSVAKQGSDPTEGSNGTFRFTRTGSTTSSLTVNYTVGGTATSGTDYTALSGSVTIGAGNTYADVSVPTLADNVVEAGGEAVTVTATDNGSTYSAYGSGATASLTIVDDPPVVTLTPTNAAEGGTAGKVRFTRTGGNTAAALTVSYTVGGPASSGVDYTALSGSVTIAASATYADVTVTALADNVVEPDEYLSVTTTFNGNSVSATVAIADDPPVIGVVRVDDATEGGADGTFRFVRSGGDPTQALTAYYAVGGTATQGTDYAALSSSITFAANAATADLDVDATDDATADADETVAVFLQPNAGYVLDSVMSAVLTILDTSTATISGRAWDDVDEDGIQDADEVGLADVAVELYNGSFFLTSTVTGGTGGYQFTNLAAGSNYHVKFVPDAADDASLSDEDEGSDDTKDSDAVPATGLTGAITVAVGQILTNMDAGFVLAAVDPGVKLSFPEGPIRGYLTATMTTQGNQTYTYGPKAIQAHDGKDARTLVLVALQARGWDASAQDDYTILIKGKLNGAVLDPVASFTYSYQQGPLDVSTVGPVATGLGGVQVTPVAMPSPIPPPAAGDTPTAFISLPSDTGYRVIVTITTAADATPASSQAVNLIQSTATAARNQLAAALPNTWDVSTGGSGLLVIRGKKLAGGAIDPIASIKVKYLTINGITGEPDANTPAAFAAPLLSGAGGVTLTLSYE